MTDAKRIVRLLFEEPWKGNMDVIDEYLAPGYIGHDPSEPEPIRGPQGFRRQIEKYLAAFPDTRFTIDDQFAEGDQVATRWTARGTHQGEIGGISPTGKEVTVTGLTFSRFEGGKVIEDWVTWDTLGMLVQLGAVPAPARA
jgi:predicted ester cyclase